MATYRRSVVIVDDINRQRFTLLMFVSIRRYQRTSQIHSYNGWESFIRKTTRHRIAIIGLLILVYMLTLSIVSYI